MPWWNDKPTNPPEEKQNLNPFDFLESFKNPFKDDYKKTKSRNFEEIKNQIKKGESLTFHSNQSTGYLSFMLYL